MKLEITKPTIGTKRVGDTWYCYGTINGYDESFKGSSQREAQIQMRLLLMDKGLEAKWEDVEYYEKTVVEKFKNPIELGGIDFNPIG